MVRPCGARGFVDPGDAVLHQCIRPLIGALLRAIMGISAHASSLPDKPRTGCLGHQFSHTLGRPILHYRFILSQTSAGKSSLVTHRQSLLVCFVLFLCSRLAPVPSSRPAGAEARRAQGPSRLAVAITLRLAPVFAGHALTA